MLAAAEPGISHTHIGGRDGANLRAGMRHFPASEPYTTEARDYLIESTKDDQALVARSDARDHDQKSRTHTLVCCNTPGDRP